MKKFSFLFVVTAMLLVSCQTDPSTEPIVGGGPVTITVSIDNTRTVLGDKGADGIYSLYWSEGDKLVVNGVESEPAQIDESDAKTASFVISESVSYPYKITYPYCESTRPNVPKVNFPTEQNYVEGSFSVGSAPMCGYVEKGKNAELKHLSGVLRFPIKAESEGVVLSKVVITSTSGAKLSGDFNVNCESATVTARSTSQNSVTYNLPSDFVLSTTTEQVLYISLPAVEVGACTVEFFDAGGGQMKSYWSGGKIKSGIVSEFKTITYRRNGSVSLDAFEKEEDVIITSSLYGYVRNASGAPIEGVAVSDGFSVVTTDSDGYYFMNESKDTWYIYITVPAEYEIPVENNQPAFYKKYDKSRSRYDFTLKPLKGGKEDKFALFVIGDPQVGTQAGLNRLNDEAVPAIKEHAATWQAQGIPCYGITLGDLISNNNSSDRSQWRQPVFDGFAKDKTGMPVFHVMGNHDNTYFNSSCPLYVDERSSTTELKAQRAYEEVCGPVNFSFDRGDMHIISMRNIMYNSSEHCENYMRAAFTHEQYEWLLQDLALVPKDKTIILCIHIPLIKTNGQHVADVFKLINNYKEAHIMSGHSHLIRDIGAVRESNVYEHNMGALCGAWWTSYMCGDGSPAGYGVFVVEGTTFTDWYHIGYSKTAKNRSHQMRLYRGNELTGASNYGYFKFNFDEDILLANVYMADSEWTVKVYEDEEYSGDMELISLSNILFDSKYYARPKIYRDETSTPSSDGQGYGYMVGSGSQSNPYCSTIPTSADIYFSGYNNGVRGFDDHAFGTNSQCYHMYMYRLKKKDFSKIRVEAIDRFNNKYTETKITTGTDYSLVAY